MANDDQTERHTISVLVDNEAGVLARVRVIVLSTA